MACLYTTGLQPSLTAVNLPVKVTAKQVSAALLVLMVYVNINALISNFCAFHRKTAVFMMSIYTHAPLLIFAEASAEINIFGQCAATGKSLSISGNIFVGCTFSSRIQKSCRCICTIGAVVGEGSTIQNGIRTGNNIYALQGIRRNASCLVEQIRNAVNIIMCGIHINTAHAEVSIHRRRAANSDRRVVSQSTVQRLVRIIKGCNSFFGILFLGKGNINRFDIAKDTNPVICNEETTRQYICTSLNNNLFQIAMHSFCTCTHHKACACYCAQHGHSQCVLLFHHTHTPHQKIYFLTYTAELSEFRVQRLLKAM